MLTVAEVSELTVAEVSELTGFTAGAVRDWIKREVIPAKKVGKQYRVREVELEAKIASITKRKTNRLEPFRNWISEANTLEKTVSEDK